MFDWFAQVEFWRFLPPITYFSYFGRGLLGLVGLGLPCN